MTAAGLPETQGKVNPAANKREAPFHGWAVGFPVSQERNVGGKNGKNGILIGRFR
jgi:hypothetical protein